MLLWVHHTLQRRGGVELEVFQGPIVSKGVGVVVAVLMVVVIVTERGCGQYKYFMYHGALRWVRADFSGNDIITTRQMEAACREETRGPVESSTALSLGPRVTCRGTITFSGPLNCNECRLLCMDYIHSLNIE